MKGRGKNPKNHFPENKIAMFWPKSLMELGKPRQKWFNLFCTKWNCALTKCPDNFKFLDILDGRALRRESMISIGFVSLAPRNELLNWPMLTLYTIVYFVPNLSVFFSDFSDVSKYFISATLGYLNPPLNRRRHAKRKRFETADVDFR